MNGFVRNVFLVETEQAKITIGSAACVVEGFALTTVAAIAAFVHKMALPQRT
jgi:hypothetical protein